MSDTKVVINCAPSDTQARAQQLLQEGIELVTAGDISGGSAKITEAQALLDQADGDRVSVVALTDDEAAQRELDAQEASAREQALRERLTAELVAKRDRYIAQTDWIMRPADARPSDMDPAVAQACDDNAAAWTAWRQQLKDYPATVEDPLDPPPFPEQPAAPKVVLT